MIGEAARNGFKTHPVLKSPAIYSNLKILFKNDLIKSKKDESTAYYYEKSLHHGESNPVETSKEFLGSLWKSVEGTEGYDLGETRIYVGKPAYPAIEEARYVRNLKTVFKELGFAKSPVLVYEPYALYYYCRFGLCKPFLPHSGTIANILVIDHGGGTINSCIIQTTRTGKLKKSRPSAPHASRHGGGLLDQFLLIRAIKRHNLPPEMLLQIFADRSELRIVEKELLLVQLEELKIRLFTEACPEEIIQGEIREHNVPGIPKPWPLSISKRDVREGFLEVWSGCHATIATTLTTSGIKNIDYVILSGGTCRLGIHKELLKRDFSDFFVPETEFIDISSHEKPVAFGLAIQALLDSYAKAEIVESKTEEHDENLSNYVARDIRVAVGTDDVEDGPKYALGDELVIRSGTPKTNVWKGENERQISLRSKPKRVFRYAFFCQGPSLLTDSAESQRQPEVIEGEDVLIKRRHWDDLERRITVRLNVNEEGRCKPRFYLAPTKAPKYFEPDRAGYNLYVPDLEERPPVAVQTKEESQIYTPNLAIDFGTSTTCICGIDLAAGKVALQSDQPLISEAPDIGYFGSSAASVVQDDLSDPKAALRRLCLSQSLAKSERLFRDGHFSQAVFEALKEIEITTREKAGNPIARDGKKLIGRNLMGRVLGSDSPLLQVSEDMNIQIAYRELLQGLMGIRNQFAHESPDVGPWDAVVWLGLANKLLQGISTAMAVSGETEEGH